MDVMSMLMMMMATIPYVKLEKKTEFCCCCSSSRMPTTKYVTCMPHVVLWHGDTFLWWYFLYLLRRYPDTQMEFFVLPFFLSVLPLGLKQYLCNCCRRMSLLLLHFRCCKCVEWNVLLIQNMILPTYGYSRIYTCCCICFGYVVSLIQSLTGYSSFKLSGAIVACLPLCVRYWPCFSVQYLCPLSCSVLFSSMLGLCR